MSYNVQCAGGAIEDVWVPGDQTMPEEQGPCGWKGKRFAGYPWRTRAELDAARTAEPCPKCGGHVAPIPVADR